MATQPSTMLTLLDQAKRVDPNGSTPVIAEMLAEDNAVVKSALVMEGNLPTGHRSTQRTGLPDAVWRLLNQGVPKAKSTTAQVDDSAGMLEVYSEVDKVLAELGGNRAQFLATEDGAFLESMSQTMESTFFGGNTATNPERFLGVEARYASLSATTTNIGYNIINFDQAKYRTTAAASGSTQTSLWIVDWHPRNIFMFYPKGTMAGLHRQWLGEQTLQDSAGNQFQGYRTHYSWNLGLAVPDWRGVVRIANIDVDTADATDKVEEAVIDGTHRLRGARGRRVIYANEFLTALFDRRAQAKTNVNLTNQTFMGETVNALRGIPILRTDGITSAEAIVS